MYGSNREGGGGVITGNCADIMEGKTTGGWGRLGASARGCEGRDGTRRQCGVGQRSGLQ